MRSKRYFNIGCIIVYVLSTFKIRILKEKEFCILILANDKN